jgi:hypothetical protein
VTLPPWNPRRVAPQRKRPRYAWFVGILTIASTLIAFFDLWLFAAGFGS